MDSAKSCMVECVWRRLDLTELHRLFRSPLAPSWGGADVFRKAASWSMESGMARGTRMRLRATSSNWRRAICLTAGS